MSTLYSNLDIQNKENATIAITGEVAWEHLTKYYEKELDRATANAELDGFRKGKAPREKVEESVGQMTILQQAAQAALGDAYPAIILEKELQVIGYPQISITKLAHGSELGFFITSTIMPEIALADYKAIAKKHDAPQAQEVTEEELDKALEQMRSMYAHSMAGEHTHEKGDPESEHDMPDLTDEFVQKLGDFKTVDEFKEQIKGELAGQKINEAKAKSREALILEIAKESEFELPDVLVEAEKDKMMGAMRDDISRMGLEYDKWLEHSGKTEEDVRKEMHDDAIDRARAEMVLKEIAKKEKLVPNPEKVQTQMEQIMKAHPDIPEENIRMYVENIYTNEVVLEFLENKESK